VIDLGLLNTLTVAQFTDALGAIFEHSPWIAQRAAAQRPFKSRLDLLDAMRTVVLSAPMPEQLGLINAHPKLGARGRERQQLTQASGGEQRRAGLDALSDEQFEHLQRLNASYLARFDFPFILAVRGHDPLAIIAQMQRRLAHEREVEVQEAIHQIGLIASYRLADTVASSPEVELHAMFWRLRWSTDPTALATEWMRAAALKVWSNSSDSLIGIVESQRAATQSESLILGWYQDAVTGTLHYAGQFGWLCALAVIQHLKSQGHTLPYTLGVFARQADSTPGSASMIAGVNPACTAAASGWLAQKLAGAKLHAARVPVVDAGRTHPGLTPDSATRALQEFLLHTR
jgi:beta-ureidopropionase / N-carbamoyl-L-amino-acid hydrolase